MEIVKSETGMQIQRSIKLTEEGQKEFQRTQVRRIIQNAATYLGMYAEVGITKIGFYKAIKDEVITKQTFEDFYGRTTLILVLVGKLVLAHDAIKEGKTITPIIIEQDDCETKKDHELRNNSQPSAQPKP